MDLSGLNNTNYTDLVQFVQAMINLAISFAALLAVVFLVKAGFDYIVSGGDGDKADKAQKSIIYTLLGLVLAFVSPLIIRFILASVLSTS